MKSLKLCRVVDVRASLRCLTALITSSPTTDENRRYGGRVVEECCLCVSLWCMRNIIFITLVKLDPPLLLTAHTSPPFCNHIRTHTQEHTCRDTQFLHLCFRNSGMCLLKSTYISEIFIFSCRGST